MEVEDRGAVNANTKVVQIRQLFRELGFLIESLTILHCDNQSAIQVANNLVAHSKMKHVELHCHYLRQLVRKKVVTLVYCRTNDPLTNIFKIPISKVKFVKLCTLLGIQEATIKRKFLQVLC